MKCDSRAHPHCLEMFARLSEYIDREMDEGERREIEEHVSNCVACFACLQSLRLTIALCRRAGRQPVPEVFSHKLQTLVQDFQRPR